MKSNWLKNITLALVIIFFQVLVFNQLEISAYVIPFVYPMLILSLIRSMNKPMLLGIAFVLGLFIDMFSNTGGAHAMGLTTLAFLRPYFLSSIGPTDSGSDHINPSIHNLGFKSYVVYAGILLFIHHIIVFFMEVFTIEDFMGTITRIVVSTITSIVLVFLLQLIFVKKED